MDSYKIEWKESARKELKRIDPKIIFEILASIEQLTCNPIPAGAKKLSGSEHTYRIRIGSY